MNGYIFEYYLQTGPNIMIERTLLYKLTGISSNNIYLREGNRYKRELTY